MELGLDVRRVDEHSVVDVKGEIDVYTAPKLREKLTHKLDAFLSYIEGEKRGSGEIAARTGKALCNAERDRVAADRE